MYCNLHPCPIVMKFFGHLGHQQKGSSSYHEVPMIFLSLDCNMKRKAQHITLSMCESAVVHVRIEE